MAISPTFQKANIGHTEAASGLVGVMKVALQLRHAYAPGLPHFRRLNPEIEQEMKKWKGNNTTNWPLNVAVKGQTLVSASHGRNRKKIFFNSGK
jgi:3-oxoacyl-(acyl-carrier-protein) synthase